MGSFSGDAYLLLEAAKWGRADKVQGMLRDGYHGDVRDEQGRSSLHWAAEGGYLHVLCLLLERGCHADALDQKNQSPLLLACNFRRTDVASCLITVGCDVNAADCQGNTPLHRAVHQNLETVTYMLCDAGADVNAVNSSGWTPLHEAARLGSESMFRLLLQRGADVDSVTCNRMTPFLTALFYYKIAQRNSYSGLDEIARLLIENGCRLSATDGQWSPLTASIAIGNSHLAALLLYHGCQHGGPRGRFSRSVLVEAFARCDPTVVRLLVETGYRVTEEETEQCARRIPAFSRSFLRLVSSSDLEASRGRHRLLTWLRMRAKSAYPLTELCRAAIRSAMNVSADDASILGSTELLPLPPSLRRFVALDHFAGVDTLVMPGDSIDLLR